MSNLVEETRNIMKKYGIRANKDLGQNFLINNEVVENIVNSIEFKKYPELFTSTTLAHAKIKEIQEMIKYILEK